LEVLGPDREPTLTKGRPAEVDAPS